MAKFEPKIGKIKFNEKEKELIAEFVESEIYGMLKRKYRPQRQTKIALTALNADPDGSQQPFYRGASWEVDRFFALMDDISKDYNKNQLQEDADNI